MEILEDLKAIVKNAPDCATHYDSKNYFTFVSEFDDGLYYSHWRKWVNNKQSMVVCQSRGINNIRSLSDIKRIIELMEWKENILKRCKSLINADDMNTGYEPSLSVFQREIDLLIGALDS